MPRACGVSVVALAATAIKLSASRRCELILVASLGQPAGNQIMGSEKA